MSAHCPGVGIYGPAVDKPGDQWSDFGLSVYDCSWIEMRFGCC